MSINNDPVIEAFVKKYGIKNLLQDIGARRISHTGKNQLILCCPFHPDNKESFSINSETGLFKCFACDAKGNLYHFIMRHYGLEFKEARQFIFARSGLDDNVNVDDLIFLYNINHLLESPEDETAPVIPTFKPADITRMYQGPDPYDYLKNRGYADFTIRRFECGFTKEWRAISYETKTLTNEERITVPGHDEYGTIIGFIGRTPIGQEPKYRYTYHYPKSHTLFNLHRAKKFSGDMGLILVEGWLDAMKLDDFGHSNVAAILGSELSDAQVKLIAKYTDKIYTMFDNDSAGFKATAGAINKLHDIVDVHYIPLGDLNDPGDITDKLTCDQLVGNAKSWFAYNM